jgi:hypothetical protein
MPKAVIKRFASGNESSVESSLNQSSIENLNQSSVDSPLSDTSEEDIQRSSRNAKRVVESSDEEAEPTVKRTGKILSTEKQLCASESSEEEIQTYSRRKRLAIVHSSDESGNSSSEVIRRKPRKKQNRRYSHYKSSSSEYDSLQSEDSANVDLSFYRAIDKHIEVKQSEKKNPEKFIDKIYDDLEAHVKNLQELSKDNNFALLSDTFESSSDFVQSLIKQCERYAALDVCENTFSPDCDDFGTVYVEKNFIRKLFDIIHTHAESIEIGFLDSYDSFGMEEFIIAMKNFGESNFFPAYINGFIDKTRNALSRSLGAGTARLNTRIDVNTSLTRRLIDHILYERVHISRLSESLVSKSLDMNAYYTQIAREHHQQNLTTSNALRESDRAYAVKRMTREGKPIELTMCYVCQSFPRSVGFIVDLTNYDSEDDEDGQSSKSSSSELEIYSSSSCSELVFLISQVADIWKLIWRAATSITQLSSTVHRFHRQTQRSSLEILKMLIHLAFQAAEHQVKFTNSCKHYQYATRAFV